MTDSSTTALSRRTRAAHTGSDATADASTPPTLSRWGDYHCIYEYGVQRGKRINLTPMEAVGWGFVYVYAITDDYLIFPADPEECLHAAAPRRRDMTAQQVSAWLDALEDSGLIVRYEDEQGERFGVFLNAPPKRTKNGKHAFRFPHPHASIAVWNNRLRQWKPSGASRRSNASRKSRPSTDSITKQSKAKQSSNSSIGERPVTPDAPPLTGSGAAAAAFAALDRIGADTDALSLPDGLTADTVIRHWLTITGTPKNPIGVLVRKLAKPRPPSRQPTPAAVAEACRGGVIRSVTLDGKTVEVHGRPVGFNSGGVVIGDRTLPPERFAEAVFA